MAYLGLTPSERSTGESVKRGGITKAGNTRARRLLIEAAWSYRFPPRVSKDMQTRIGAAPRTAREIAWKAQMRLCGRFRTLTRKGKRPTIVVTAIARELSAFIWAINREVRWDLMRRRTSRPGSSTARAMKGSTGPHTPVRSNRPITAEHRRTSIVQQRGRDHGRGTPVRHYVADRKIDARV